MDDDELIEWFIDVTRDVGLGEIDTSRVDTDFARKFPVSHETLRKYRAGERPKLYGPTKSAILTWLAVHAAHDRPTYETGIETAVRHVEDVLADLRHAIGAPAEDTRARVQCDARCAKILEAVKQARREFAQLQAQLTHGKPTSAVRKSLADLAETLDRLAITSEPEPTSGGSDGHDEVEARMWPA